MLPVADTLTGMPPSWFAMLSPVERHTLQAALRRRRFAKGDYVFHEGDAANAVHVIVKGRAAIRVSTPFGNVATLNVLGRDASFGELALLDPTAPRSASVVALDPLETLSLRTEEFDRLRTEVPGVGDAIVGVLVDQVRQLSTRLLEALYVPADQRVLRRLHDMVAVNGGANAVVELTQDEFATMAGTTRSTVNQVFKAAESEGIVLLARGRVQVLDAPALTRRAGLR
jgi:CRP/FNR family transcriptional regulator, cyclic AMP receptor protein